MKLERTQANTGKRKKTKKVLKYKTATIEKTLNPVWNFERWTVCVDEPLSNYTLHIHVYDYDRRSRNDDMGEASFSLSGVPLDASEPVDVPMELKGRSVSGVIKLRLALKREVVAVENSELPSKSTQQFVNLMVGCRAEPEKVLEFLEKEEAKKINVNVAIPLRGQKVQEGCRGLSPLMWALLIPKRESRRQILKKLLDLGASVEYRVMGTGDPQADQLTPVYFAALLGMLVELQTLLEASERKSCDDPAHCLLDGSSPLMAAMLFTRKATARGLLEMGADVNHPNETMVTPLMLAARLFASQHFMQRLVEAGGDINAVSRYGSTALYEAARAGHIDVVNYLSGLKHCQLHVHSSGLSPLLAATVAGHMDCALALIRASKKAKQLDLMMVKQNEHGDTTKLNALAIFALAHNRHAVEQILKAGANHRTSVVIHGNVLTISSLLIATNTCPKSKLKRVTRRAERSSSKDKTKKETEKSPVTTSTSTLISLEESND